MCLERHEIMEWEKHSTRVTDQHVGTTSYNIYTKCYVCVPPYPLFLSLFLYRHSGSTEMNSWCSIPKNFGLKLLRAIILLFGKVEKLLKQHSHTKEALKNDDDGWIHDNVTTTTITDTYNVPITWYSSSKSPKKLKSKMNYL